MAFRRSRSRSRTPPPSIHAVIRTGAPRVLESAPVEGARKGGCLCADCLNERAARDVEQLSMGDLHVMHLHRRHASREASAHGTGSAGGSKGSKVDEGSKDCTEVSEVDEQGTKGGAESSGGGEKGSKVDEEGAKGGAKGSKVGEDVPNTLVSSFADDMRVIAQAHLAAWNNDITDRLFPPPSQKDGVKDSPEATKLSSPREAS